MKPIVIRQDEAWICLLLSILPIGMAIYGFSAGVQAWIVWAYLAFGVVGFVGSFIGANHTDTFSEEGITRAGLFGKKTILWSDVIQVRTFYLGRHRRGWTIHYYNRLGFTFKGGYPIYPGQNPTLWMLKNLNTSVDTSYREDLEKLVLHCYGPLDS